MCHQHHFVYMISFISSDLIGLIPHPLVFLPKVLSSSHELMSSSEVMSVVATEVSLSSHEVKGPFSMMVAWYLAAVKGQSTHVGSTVSAAFTVTTYYDDVRWASWCLKPPAIVNSTACLGLQQGKNNGSALLAPCEGNPPVASTNERWITPSQVDFPHKTARDRVMVSTSWYHHEGNISCVLQSVYVIVVVTDIVMPGQ